MKVTLKTKGYMVVDGFLPGEQAELVWNYFKTERFARIDAGEQNGSWRVEDGSALRGPTVGYRVKWHYQYPSGCALDILMKAVVDQSDELKSVIGKFGEDWNDFTAFPTLYHPGTGLHWHRDAEVNTGSYIYYAHPEWNIEWGGELLLADESTHDIPEEYGIFFHKPVSLHGIDKKHSPGTHLDNQDANELLSKKGLGEYVFPKPNRLVVIRCGTPHKVNRVNREAGAHFRASIGGFFKKNQK